jgi:hypothetical protein
MREIASLSRHLEVTAKKFLLERWAQEGCQMQKALCLAVGNDHETVARLQ